MSFISKHELPNTLWNDEALQLPSCIVSAYESKLRSIDKLEYVKKLTEFKSHGGETLEATLDHYCKIFRNSVSRMQCVILDPHDSFGSISSELLATLSSHQVTILDAPCGAGAASLSLLATIRELRQSKIIPHLPLTVTIFAADISDHALNLFGMHLDEMLPLLARSGISVNFTTRKWDATNAQQTNQILDDMISNHSEINEYLVLISNFSGASKDEFESFSNSFIQFWIRLSGIPTRNSTILWIEPDSRSAKEMFGKVDKLRQPFAWFRRIPKGIETVLGCRYRWFCTIKSKFVNSGVMVHQYSRTS